MALMNKEQVTKLAKFLEGPDGCNFQQSDPNDAKTITWNCDHTARKTIGWLLIYSSSHDEAEENVAEIQRRDGYCDCEVLFNALGDPDENGMVDWR